MAEVRTRSIQSIQDDAASASARLYQRALKVMPGGCSRNTILSAPHPLYAARGRGCHVTDIEGTERLDFSNNMGSLIHGHAHPAIVDAVAAQLRLGSAFMMGTEAEVRYAEYLCARVPGLDKIRFVNSGTEAVMCALKVARAFTGRTMIAKVEGAYHGVYDYAEVSETATPSTWGDIDGPASVPAVFGTPASVLADVLILPFNDTKRALSLLDDHAGQLACILIDLIPHRVGLVPAEAKFVRALREWTQVNNVLFICDEVITFRTAFTGAQSLYGLRSDLTTMGKVIGGGFPVGALAGRDDVMSVLDPLTEPVLFPHAGTFSANPVTMTAGLAAMQLFDQASVERLNRLGELARSQISEVIARTGLPMSVTGAGSMFRIHLKSTTPRNYREAYANAAETKARQTMLRLLSERGILLIGTGTGMLSTPMSERDIDQLGTTLLTVLEPPEVTASQVVANTAENSRMLH